MNKMLEATGNNAFDITESAIIDNRAQRGIVSSGQDYCGSSHGNAQCSDLMWIDIRAAGGVLHNPFKIDPFEHAESHILSAAIASCASVVDQRIESCAMQEFGIRQHQVFRIAISAYENDHARARPWEETPLQIDPRRAMDLKFFRMQVGIVAQRPFVMTIGRPQRAFRANPSDCGSRNQGESNNGGCGADGDFATTHRIQRYTRVLNLM